MSRLNERKAASGWVKFRLLMWKNFLQQWRHPIKTLLELFIPALTMCLVLLIRWLIEPNVQSTVTFRPVPVNSLNDSLPILYQMNISRLSIAYSPRSEVLDDVLKTAVADLLADNAVDIIKGLIKDRIENLTLPPEWDLPDFTLPPEWSLPDFTLPPEWSLPDFTLPPEWSLPDFTLPPQWSLPDFTLPPDINLPNITLPPNIGLPDLGNLNDAIMEFIKRLIRIDAYNSSTELRQVYAQEENTLNVIAAIQFDDSLYGATELPKNITYSIRFPERPRFHQLYQVGSRYWRTDLLFPVFEMPGPRGSNPNGGRDPGYVFEMFIVLQHMISTTLISKITGESLRSFTVNLQRYPHPEYVQDLAVDALQFMFPMFILISYTYSAVNIIRDITVEKESQLKETLKIMGLPTWLHWTAWFFKEFLFFTLSTVLIVVILKVNWFTNEDGFNHYAVFTNTPWSVLLFYILLYVACIIFFCFMISGFFSKGSTASLFGGVVWFLTYVPAFMLAMDVSMSVPLQIFTCVSINSAMSYGFQLLLAKESTGGIQWGEFMNSPASYNTRLLFGHVVIMLFVDCVLYMLITLYLEQVLPGPYGTPKKWYFLVQKRFWVPSKYTEEEINIDIPTTPEITKELDPLDHAVGVKMANLTKVFGNNVAVNNLSLNIYDDQITVLLGHNGAGKSTTISMLIGNLKVTRGSVWVAGYDITWQSREARQNIGLCPQHNVLFDDLTVKEHLEFFAQLKGFKGKELKVETDTLIEKLELQEKRHYLAKGLSGGQKRRLCVGVALSGGAKVVLLDEPTSGMDPSSRRALWDLLQKEKQGRSMILTTHFMDEADVLGDRIAIMSNGRLQCVGSPFFLKNHFGVGYTLVIVKDEGFDLDICTAVINTYIPDTPVKEDRGTEVTYSLKNNHSHKFEEMLTDLESKIEGIKFKNYGLIPTSLEDVFMSVGSEVANDESDDSDIVTDSGSDEAHKYDFESSSTEGLNADDAVHGIRLLWQHVLAIWIKLWLVWSRSWGLMILVVLVPLVQMNSTLGVTRYVMSSTPRVQSRPLTLTQGFTNTESILEFNGTSLSSLGALAASAYEAMVNAGNNMKATVVDEPVEDYYLNITADVNAMGAIRHRVLTGATFSDDSATAWFSNFGYHDIAISLADLHTALLKTWEPSAEIRVNNHPLEVTYRDQRNVIMMVQMMSMQLASGIGSSVAMISAVFVMFYIKERVSRAKLLQKAAGIQPIVMWGSAAVFDWIWYMCICVTIIISCLAFGVVGLSSIAELGRLYLCLMVYGAAMLPLGYLFTLVFSGPAVGFVALLFINVIFGIIGPQIVDALAQPELPTGDVAMTLDRVLQFYPLYSLITAVRRLNYNGMVLSSCFEMCEQWSSTLNVTQCSISAMCEVIDLCCVDDNTYFEWEAGILRYLTVMLGTCAACWIVFMIIEYNLIQKVIRWERRPPPIDEATVDADVADEARHVTNGNLNDTALVARGLSKYYRRNLAVNQVSFSVSDSECFGLLGVNGAGKTTTFKMLMGDESISSGDAHIAGYSVRKKISKVYKHIGYCPQFDAVFEELTGRETIRVFSMLRGLRAQLADDCAVSLAAKLGFSKHLDKRVKQYSGGNKRKLSTAVALLGNTRVLFVDEPTTGVDPAAKRQVWRAIRGAQRAGRAVVLTSHSMEECEALCSRLTIMVSGRFQCLGTPQHLKNKFSEGYTLKMKTKTQEIGPSTSTASSGVDTVKQYINNNFNNPKLMEEYQGLLTYYLPDHSVPWSKMFGIMERAKSEVGIIDYHISQTTLEQIFLQFTKYQQESVK